MRGREKIIFRYSFVLCQQLPTQTHKNTFNVYIIIQRNCWHIKTWDVHSTHLMFYKYFQDFYSEWMCLKSVIKVSTKYLLLLFSPLPPQLGLFSNKSIPTWIRKLFWLLIFIISTLTGLCQTEIHPPRFEAEFCPQFLVESKQPELRLLSRDQEWEAGEWVNI